MDNVITDQITKKKLYFVINIVFLSAFCSVAQDNDFSKQIIKESFDVKTALKQFELEVLYKPLLNDPVKVETGPDKIKIPMYATYNHSLDSLLRTCLPNGLDEKYAISPYSFMPYTNRKVSSDEYYNAEPIFVDGRWVPASSLFGTGTSVVVGIIMNLYSKGVIPNDDPVMPKKSKKQKTLEQIKSTYNIVTTSPSP